MHVAFDKKITAEQLNREGTTKRYPERKLQIILEKVFHIGSKLRIQEKRLREQV